VWEDDTYFTATLFYVLFNLFNLAASYALAWAKKALWARPVCLSVASFSRAAEQMMY
jgi:hypothetical protein